MNSGGKEGKKKNLSNHFRDTAIIQAGVMEKRDNCDSGYMSMVLKLACSYKYLG